MWTGDTQTDSDFNSNTRDDVDGDDDDEAEEECKQATTTFLTEEKEHRMKLTLFACIHTHSLT